jgi:hypothetical protein
MINKGYKKSPSGGFRGLVGQHQEIIKNILLQGEYYGI